jgi:nucleoside-triphosphatase
VGKTTLIKEITLSYRNRVAGFYTEEIKEGRERRGFRLKVFTDGEKPAEGLLAEKGLKSSAKIGKYGVNLSVLEELGVSALDKALSSAGKLLVIDEIGSMENLSDRFRETLLKCLQSPRPVLATIRYKSQPFTDHIKRLEDKEILHLTKENFPEIKEQARRWLIEKLG